MQDNSSSKSIAVSEAKKLQCIPVTDYQTLQGELKTKRIGLHLISVKGDIRQSFLKSISKIEHPSIPVGIVLFPNIVSGKGDCQARIIEWMKKEKLSHKLVTTSNKNGRTYEGESILFGVLYEYERTFKEKLCDLKIGDYMGNGITTPII